MFNELELGAHQGFIASEADLGILPASALPEADIQNYQYLPDLQGLIDGDIGAAADAYVADLPTL